jgi:hypothetical protein
MYIENGGVVEWRVIGRWACELRTVLCSLRPLRSRGSSHARTPTPRRSTRRRAARRTRTPRRASAAATREGFPVEARPEAGGRRDEEAHAEEAHAEEVHAEEVHAEEVHAEEAHAEEAHAEEAHAEEVHAEEVHTEEVHTEGRTEAARSAGQPERSLTSASESPSAQSATRTPRRTRRVSSLTRAVPTTQHASAEEGIDVGLQEHAWSLPSTVLF